MITLDQVQKLEKKVNDAVDLINRFKAEKVVLEEKIENYELRIMELEEIADQLNKDQNEIEDKIIGALNQLEDLELTDTDVVLEEKSVEIEEEALQEEKDSVESSVSKDEDIVITDEEKSDESVNNSENTVESPEIYEDEPIPEEDIVNEAIVEREEETDATLSESEEDNQSELQESITESPQDGLPADETVKEEEVPTVESEFGEMPEDKSADENKSGTDLFEQSLDIF